MPFYGLYVFWCLSQKTGIVHPESDIYSVISLNSITSPLVVKIEFGNLESNQNSILTIRTNLSSFHYVIDFYKITLDIYIYK